MGKLTEKPACKCIFGADKGICLKCMEEYIDFMHEYSMKDAIFCAAHGQVDSPETIAKAEQLRAKLAKFKE